MGGGVGDSANWLTLEEVIAQNLGQGEKVGVWKNKKSKPQSAKIFTILFINLFKDLLLLINWMVFKNFQWVLMKALGVSTFDGFLALCNSFYL